MTHVSAWCQRWRDRKEAWRLAHPDVRFTGAGYEVAPIRDDTTAERYVLAHHYSGTYPAALLRYGLYASTSTSRTLVGVAVYSNPTNDRVLTNAFPTLAPAYESMELGRFVLDDDVPGNAEVWFLARCHEYLRAAGVRGVVSHADPVRRRLPDGAEVTGGHVGIIYQAANAAYTGTTGAATLWVLPDCTVITRAALQKIRQRKTGHRYAEQMLIRHGARPIRDGEDPKVWLREAKAAARVQTFRHPGCHRYLFLTGGGRFAVRRRLIGLATSTTYPKTIHDREMVPAP